MTPEAAALALEHHRQGRLEQAEALYRAAIAVQPADADALHLLGVVCRQTGRVAEAVDLLVRAVALLPGMAAAHCNLGNALADAGRLAEAAACHREALRLDPALAESRIALAGVEDKIRRAEALRSHLDREYAEGRWAYLATAPQEYGRHGVVAAYVALASPGGGSVLELGCGECTLLRHLQPRHQAGYMGVDISAVALEKAKARGVTVPLVQSALEVFEPPAPVDVVIFNEVLLYAEAPLAQLRRYRPFLKPGGAVIVSWFRMEGETRQREDSLWQGLEGPGWQLLDASELRNTRQGLTWTIRAYRAG